MNRKRKPLNDALAKSFVYGETEPNINEAKLNINEVELNTTKNEEDDQTNNTVIESKLEDKNTINNVPTNQKISMIDKLQIKPKEGTKRFTVDLPESQHRKLSILAAHTGRTKADIVRMLLEEALDDITD